MGRLSEAVLCLTKYTTIESGCSDLAAVIFCCMTERVGSSSCMIVALPSLFFSIIIIHIFSLSNDNCSRMYKAVKEKVQNNYFLSNRLIKMLNLYWDQIILMI